MFIKKYNGINALKNNNIFFMLIVCRIFIKILKTKNCDSVRIVIVIKYKKEVNMKKVENVIMYQATTRDYKVGDKLEFGKSRNYQAERVFATNYKMEGAENNMSELFLDQKIKKKKKLKREEMKPICDILFNYGFAMREIGYEICRQKYHSEEPSRLSAMFLCENEEQAKCYLTTAKSKGGHGKPKVVGVRLKGKLLKTSNSFNMRGGKSLDEFIEQAHDYWNGVGDDFEDIKSVEYLFEGEAEIVEVKQYD